jgi:hypothetical protein
VVTRLPTIRASDSDREQVAERLRQAAIEGRLTTDELEERLEAASAARTYGELDPLVADLPVSRSSQRPRAHVRGWVPAAGAAALVFTILSMLAGAGRHFDERFGDHPDSFGHAHHLMAAAASIAAVFAGILVCATVVTCATLLWRARSRRASHKRIRRY